MYILHAWLFPRKNMVVWILWTSQKILWKYIYMKFLVELVFKITLLWGKHYARRTNFRSEKKSLIIFCNWIQIFRIKLFPVPSRQTYLVRNTGSKRFVVFMLKYASNPFGLVKYLKTMQTIPVVSICLYRNKAVDSSAPWTNNSKLVQVFLHLSKAMK